MADTGYNWDDTWTSGGTSVDGDSVADDGNAESDAISLDGKAACLISITLTEGDVGAPDGNPVTVYILGGVDDTVTYESELYGGSPWSFTITPTTQNTSVYKLFSVDPGAYDDFKIKVVNTCGRALATTVRYKTATIPAAS